MDLKKITLEPLRGKTVAVLGYGNQGRAHALNLRDSGIRVVVGARAGAGAERARIDGFAPEALADAAGRADVVAFLLSDDAIGAAYASIENLLRERAPVVGFAHGLALHAGLISPVPGCRHFLVGPKGAGVVLRERFEKGGGLPGVFALSDAADLGLRGIALAYAKAIGCASSILVETTFAEETESDLFGEQTVLCGGLPLLMQAAFDTLVEAGFSPDMAFLECCYEVKTITELWLRHGPRELRRQISGAARYGGATRGPRVVPAATRERMREILGEIRSGAFVREWVAGQAEPEAAPGEAELERVFLRLRGALT